MSSSRGRGGGGAFSRGGGRNFSAIDEEWRNQRSDTFQSKGSDKNPGSFRGSTRGRGGAHTPNRFHSSRGGRRREDPAVGSWEGSEPTYPPTPQSQHFGDRGRGRGRGRGKSDSPNLSHTPHNFFSNNNNPYNAFHTGFSGSPHNTKYNDSDGFNATKQNRSFVQSPFTSTGRTASESATHSITEGNQFGQANRREEHASDFAPKSIHPSIHNVWKASPLIRETCPALLEEERKLIRGVWKRLGGPSASETSGGDPPDPLEKFVVQPNTSGGSSSLQPTYVTLPIEPYRRAAAGKVLEGSDYRTTMTLEKSMHFLVQHFLRDPARQNQVAHASSSGLHQADNGSFSYLSSLLWREPDRVWAFLWDRFRGIRTSWSPQLPHPRECLDTSGSTLSRYVDNKTNQRIPEAQLEKEYKHLVRWLEFTVAALFFGAAALCRTEEGCEKFLIQKKNFLESVSQCFSDLTVWYRRQQGRYRHAELFSVLLLIYGLQQTSKVEDQSLFCRFDSLTIQSVQENETVYCPELPERSLNLSQVYRELERQPHLARSRPVRAVLRLLNCWSTRHYFEFLALCRGDTNFTEADNLTKEVEAGTEDNFSFERPAGDVTFFLTPLQRAVVFQSFTYARYRAVLDLLIPHYHVYSRLRVLGFIPLPTLAYLLLMDEMNCRRFLEVLGVSHLLEYREDVPLSSLVLLDENGKRIQTQGMSEDELLNDYHRMKTQRGGGIEVLNLTTPTGHPLISSQELMERCENKSKLFLPTLPEYFGFEPWDTFQMKYAAQKHSSTSTSKYMGEPAYLDEDDHENLSDINEDYFNEDELDDEERMEASDNNNDNEDDVHGDDDSYAAEEDDNDYSSMRVRHLRDLHYPVDWMALLEPYCPPYRDELQAYRLDDASEEYFFAAIRSQREEALRRHFQLAQRLRHSRGLREKSIDVFLQKMDLDSVETSSSIFDESDLTEDLLRKGEEEEEGEEGTGAEGWSETPKEQAEEEGDNGEHPDNTFSSTSGIAAAECRAAAQALLARLQQDPMYYPPNPPSLPITSDSHTVETAVLATEDRIKSTIDSTALTGMKAPATSPLSSWSGKTTSESTRAPSASLFSATTPIGEIAAQSPPEDLESSQEEREEGDEEMEEEEEFVEEEEEEEQASNDEEMERKTEVRSSEKKESLLFGFTAASSVVQPTQTPFDFAPKPAETQSSPLARVSPQTTCPASTTNVSGSSSLPSTANSASNLSKEPSPFSSAAAPYAALPAPPVQEPRTPDVYTPLTPPLHVEDVTDLVTIQQLGKTNETREGDPIISLSRSFMEKTASSGLPSSGSTSVLPPFPSLQKPSLASETDERMKAQKKSDSDSERSEAEDHLLEDSSDALMKEEETRSKFYSSVMTFTPSLHIAAQLRTLRDHVHYYALEYQKSLSAANQKHITFDGETNSSVQDKVDNAKIMLMNAESALEVYQSQLQKRILHRNEEQNPLFEEAPIKEIEVTEDKRWFSTLFHLGKSVSLGEQSSCDDGEHKLLGNRILYLADYESMETARDLDDTLHHYFASLASDIMHHFFCTHLYSAAARKKVYRELCDMAILAATSPYQWQQAQKEFQWSGLDGQAAGDLTVGKKRSRSAAFDVSCRLSSASDLPSRLDRMSSSALPQLKGFVLVPLHPSPPSCEDLSTITHPSGAALHSALGGPYSRCDNPLQLGLPLKATPTFSLHAFILLWMDPSTISSFQTTESGNVVTDSIQQVLARLFQLEMDGIESDSLYLSGQSRKSLILPTSREGAFFDSSCLYVAGQIDPSFIDVQALLANKNIEVPFDTEEDITQEQASDESTSSSCWSNSDNFCGSTSTKRLIPWTCVSTVHYDISEGINQKDWNQVVHLLRCAARAVVAQFSTSSVMATTNQLLKRKADDVKAEQTSRPASFTAAVAGVLVLVIGKGAETDMQFYCKDVTHLLRKEWRSLFTEEGMNALYGASALLSSMNTNVSNEAKARGIIRRRPTRLSAMRKLERVFDSSNAKAVVPSSTTNDEQTLDDRRKREIALQADRWMPAFSVECISVMNNNVVSVSHVRDAVDHGLHNLISLYDL